MFTYVFDYLSTIYLWDSVASLAFSSHLVLSSQASWGKHTASWEWEVNLSRGTNGCSASSMNHSASIRQGPSGTAAWWSKDSPHRCYSLNRVGRHARYRRQNVGWLRASNLLRFLRAPWRHPYLIFPGKLSETLPLTSPASSQSSPALSVGLSSAQVWSQISPVPLGSQSPQPDSYLILILISCQTVCNCAIVTAVPFIHRQNLARIRHLINSH